MGPSSPGDLAAFPQLQTCAHEFHHATVEARGLLLYYSEELLCKRPSPASWSALECVAHLNLATRATLPGLQQAIEQAQPAKSEKAYHMDLTGRLLAWSLEPPPLIKLKTPKMTEPVESGGPRPVQEEFDRLHEELIALLHAAAGKAIDEQKMKSPFANLSYNAYSAFRIIAAHDRRHLWQAHNAMSVRKASARA